MRIILGLTLFLSFSAFALDWNELENGKTYKLTQTFQLQQIERSGSILDIMKGHKVKLLDVTPLDMINVLVYVFQYGNCPGPSMKTEMEIIPVQGTSPMVEVGAELELNCRLQIYVESKDIMTKSFLK